MMLFESVSWETGGVERLENLENKMFVCFLKF